MKDAVRKFLAFACDNFGLGLPFVVSLYKEIWFVAAGPFSIISNIHVLCVGSTMLRRPPLMVRHVDLLTQRLVSFPSQLSLKCVANVHDLIYIPYITYRIYRTVLCRPT